MNAGIGSIDKAILTPDSLNRQTTEYGAVNYDDYTKAFEQLKAGLVSVSLDLGPEDVDVMKTLLRRLDLIP